MAKVLGSCKSTSESNLNTVMNSENFVLSQLESLPPSKKLLKFYQEQLTKYDSQDVFLLKKIQHLSHILDKSDRLKSELTTRDSIIADLRSQLDKEKEERRIESCSDPLVSGRSAKHKGRVNHNAESSSASAGEVEYLKEQIIKQEICHKKALASEKNKLKSLNNQWRQERLETQLRIGEQQETIKSLNQTVQEVSQRLVDERLEHRTTENAGLNEKARLTRKLEYLEKYGNEACGGNAEQRRNDRQSAEKALTAEIARLTRDAEEREVAAQKLYESVCQLEKSNAKLTADLHAKSASAAASSSKSRQENEVLRQRLEKLDKRRRLDNEGYENDIKTLRRQVKSLECKVFSVATSKQQEMENEKVIQDIREQLSRRKYEKKEWVS